MNGISVVIPVQNGAQIIEETLAAIDRLKWPGELEIIVVNDRSRDNTGERVAAWQGRWPVVLLENNGVGAAAALNTGLAAARHPLLAQVDQDVAPAPDWLVSLVPVLSDGPKIAAVQGVYVADSRDGLLGRLAALDLSLRYRTRGRVDHVCTGNTLYRTLALRQIHGLDEGLGYGYDNDASYRLSEAGFELVRVSRAVAVHRWPSTLRGYMRKQYGLGLGRLDVIRKHPSRWKGDSVSGMRMILHAGLAAIAFPALVLSVLGWLVGLWPAGVVALPVLVLTALLAERSVSSFVAAPGVDALLLGPLHLTRDLAWCSAIWVWAARRMSGRPASPVESMAELPVVDPPE